MKIYIYRHLLADNFLNWYKEIYEKRAYAINHHYDWFKDILSLMMQHETSNPEDADYFFIPLYLLPFQFQNMDISNYINSCNYLDKGRHLLFASGDFGQRAQSVYEGHHEGRAYKNVYPWLDQRFMLIALESTADLLTDDIALPPYQIEFEPPLMNEALYDGASSKNNRQNAVQCRRLLYSFCGVLSYAQLADQHIRGSHGMPTIAGNGDDWFVGNSQAALQLYGPAWGNQRVMMARSTFTLCPAGFGRWTFRWIEALLAGSIPVVISDGYILPFSNHFDWSKYILIIPEKDLKNIDNILRLKYVSDILKIQKNIANDQHLFKRANVLNLLKKTLAEKIKPLD